MERELERQYKQTQFFEFKSLHNFQLRLYYFVVYYYFAIWI